MSAADAIDLVQPRIGSDFAQASGAEKADAALTLELAELGFVHLRNVVPSDRVAEFKRLVQQWGADANVHDTPIFDILLDDLAVHRTIESHVGQDVYYFGWASIQPAGTPIEHGYHDDAKGFPVAVDAAPISLIRKPSSPHDSAKHPIWPVYRLFIYLDNHENHSGGTKFRAHGHRRHALFSKNGLKALIGFRFGNILLPGAGYVNPPVQPGDAILFNLKCKHSGYFIRLRAPLDRLALPTFLDNAIKRLTLKTPLGRTALSLFARPFCETRTSVIIDFCADSDWSRGFQVNRVLHPHNHKKWQQLFDCNRPEFVAQLAGRGVRVLNNPILHRLEAFLLPR